MTQLQEVVKPVDYETFARRYAGIVQAGVLAVETISPDVRTSRLETVESALAREDKTHRAYVDRAALLGPEFGGTVLGAGQVAVAAGAER